jgi:hypothetical protein
VIFSTNEASLCVEVNISHRHTLSFERRFPENKKNPCKKEKGEVVLREKEEISTRFLIKISQSTKSSCLP